MNHISLISHQGRVLLALHENPDKVLREIAAICGITERSVQQFVSELQEAGMLRKRREGRKNIYTLRLTAKAKKEIEDLLKV